MLNPVQERKIEILSPDEPEPNFFSRNDVTFETKKQQFIQMPFVA